MNWSEASSYYQNILKSILKVQKYALDVSRIPSARVSSNLIKSLTDGVEPVKRQLHRLEKGEFRIAVVGLEKAGKSTFVNAWLECDLLPTDSKRCTFTTTQIHSVSNENEQRLEIITKSNDKFNELKSELQRVSQGSTESARRAQEDLDVIEQNKESLDQVIQDGKKEIRFTQIRDISDSLYKYVADVRFAHAIHEVHLFTSNLAETDGIVFFDVPGLNSGLGKHLDESRDMLMDCDAVICIQDSRRPSLEAHEQKLVEFIKEGDELVGISAKIFVFAGQIDLHGSEESLSKDYEEICKEWNKRCRLPEDHIILGSAAAYLLLNEVAGKELFARVGNKKDISRKLSLIRRNNEISTEEELISATGIPEIKKRIKRYLNEERIQVLKQRCDEPIKRIKETSNQIYLNLKQNFSDNPDEARKQDEFNRETRFSEWWGIKWSELEPLANTYFQEHFDTKSKEEEVESVKLLHNRFNQIVHDEISKLQHIDPKKIQNIFNKHSRPVFDAQVANDSWRGILYDKDIIDFLDNMSRELSIELFKDCQSYINYMSSLIWNSPAVKNHLIKNGEEEFRIQIESGLKALFLRFARPIAEALIRGPLGSERRNNIFKKLNLDIEMLQNFYSGNEPEFEKISRYIMWGIDLIQNPVVRKTILGIVPTTPLVLATNIKNVYELKPECAKTPDKIIEEVKSDLEAFEKYLKEIIFNAAGFASYLSQELKRLRDKFASNKDYWAGVARNEYRNGNTKLLEELPYELKNTEFEIEISNRLRQLRLAIEEFKEKELI